MPRGPFAPFLHYVRSRRRSADSDGDLLTRFAADRDEDAFAELVRRHGPLVWGVARQVLGHDQDAEDAFQATFLLLARNAKSVRAAAAVAGWLHGTAWRVATKARARANTRRQRERSIPARPNGDVGADVALREMQSLLHAEIAALPAKYRAPFVLCVLEGRGRSEVARSLGWNEGTLSTRLAWARQRLRSRLLSRGVDVAVALAAVEVTRGAVPAALASSAITAARTGVVSTAVAALVHGGVMTTKLAQFAALGLVLGGIAIGSAGLLGSDPPQVPNAGKDNGKAAPSPVPPVPVKKPLTCPVTVSGTATGPDGKPVKDATVTLFLANVWQPTKSLKTAATDAKGHYEIREAPMPVRDPKGERVVIQIAATATGLPFTWSPLYSISALPDQRSGGIPGEQRFAASPKTIDIGFTSVARLQGQIKDQLVKPVGGVEVEIFEVNWLRPKPELGFHPDPNILIPPGSGFESNRFNVFGAFIPKKLRKVTTGPDGRFRLDGLPADCLFGLFVKHPDYAAMTLFTATTTEPLPDLNKDQILPIGFQAWTGDIDLQLEKPRLIPLSVVSDLTGKPVADIGVHIFTSGKLQVSADGKTNRQGQVSLKLPPGEYTAETWSNKTDYVAYSGPLTVTPEPGEQAHTIRLFLGCVLKVEAVDADSGRPLKGVTFAQTTDEPNVRNTVGPATGGSGSWPTPTDDYGTFRIAVRPGKRQFEIDTASRQRYTVVKGTTEPVEFPAGGEVKLRFELRKK